MSITLEDIRRASAQIEGSVVRTLCRRSPALTVITGAQVWIKFENTQFTSSFKDRGALVKLLALTATERKGGVIAASAGNHAQGVAYHAQRLGIPAVIVMPKGTPNVKVRQTRNYEADVLLTGENLDEAATAAEELRRRRGLVFIQPYDDPLIIAGQGTVGLEMLQAAPELEVLLVPVGGGGLISGVAVAAKALKPEIEVIGVECELYPSMSQAVRGEPIRCTGQTLAEGIAVKAPGSLTAPIVRDLVDDLLLVSEASLERAIDLYLEVEKTVAEGAGAATLAALLQDPARFEGRAVGLVLSGGNIDTRLLSGLLMRGLMRDGRIARLRIEIADRPGSLAAVAQVIAEQDGNILEVFHQRMFADLPAKLADLDVVVETEDARHVRRIMRALQAKGYRTEVLSDLAHRGGRPTARHAIE